MLKEQETGRSMVEMLGVLAIIGVLSIGGIAGYTRAMRSHRANEIAAATSRLYVMGISGNNGAGDEQLLYSTSFGAVPSGATEITYTTQKQIEITGLTDAALCAEVKEKFGDKAGTCPTEAPFKLTVTLGEVSEPAITCVAGQNCEDEDRCYVCNSWGCLVASGSQACGALLGSCSNNWDASSEECAGIRSKIPCLKNGTCEFSSSMLICKDGTKNPPLCE